MYGSRINTLVNIVNEYMGSQWVKYNATVVLSGASQGCFVFADEGSLFLSCCFPAKSLQEIHPFLSEPIGCCLDLKH